MLGAKGFDELEVFLLRVVLVEDAEVGLAPIQRLGGLPETASETVVNEGVFEDLLGGNKKGL